MKNHTAARWQSGGGGFSGMKDKEPCKMHLYATTIHFRILDKPNIAISEKKYYE